jgi:hypothetical protein
MDSQEPTKIEEKACCKKTREIMEYLKKCIPISGNIFCHECNDILK